MKLRVATVVAIEVAHRAVVHVDVVARLHRLGGEADDLVVLAQRLVDRDRRDGDLVAGRDVAAAHHVGARQAGAGQQVGARDHDVVGRVQPDGQRSARFLSRHAILLVGRHAGAPRHAKRPIARPTVAVARRADNLAAIS